MPQSFQTDSASSKPPDSCLRNRCQPVNGTASNSKSCFTPDLRTVSLINLAPSKASLHISLLDALCVIILNHTPSPQILLMQLDSHRRRISFNKSSCTIVPSSTTATATTTTTTAIVPPQPAAAVIMPCPRSRCSLPKTFTAEDGTEMQTWASIRREHVRNMRRMVKRVVFYMALIEAIRIGPDTIVFAGTKGYPEKSCHDFGIAYYAGYILSYIYLCIFTIVWKPLFSWWVSPSAPSTDEPQTVEKVTSVLQQINMVLLPVSIGLHLLEYIFWLGMTFIYVDARPVDSNKMPKNTQKNWLARLMLLVGIFVTTTFGYSIFQILADTGLAHVKTLEYMIIVVPIQINLGILLGSAMQWRMEKRLERKAMAVKAIELGSSDEKEALLV